MRPFEIFPMILIITHFLYVIKKVMSEIPNLLDLEDNLEPFKPCWVHIVINHIEDGENVIMNIYNFYLLLKT